MYWHAYVRRFALKPSFSNRASGVVTIVGIVLLTASPGPHALSVCDGVFVKLLHS